MTLSEIPRSGVPCRLRLSFVWMTCFACMVSASVLASPDFRELMAVIPTKDYGFSFFRPLDSAPSVLHWRFGIDLSDFPTTLKDALEQTSSIPVANYVASSKQRVSLEIPRSFGPGLFAGELREVSRFGVAIIAYRIPTLPDQETAARELFEFARTMHIETIVSESVPAHMALIGMLAREYNIKVALGGSYREIVDALRHAESNVGACVNTAKLAQEGVTPDKLVSDLHDRIMIVELQDRPENPDSVPLNTTRVLKVLYSHGVKPSLFVTRTTGMASGAPTQELQRAVNGLDDALRPLIADQAAQRSRMPDQGLGAATAEQRAGAAALTAGNSTVWDPATPDRRAAVDAALPQRAVVTPKKSRKLLVIDLNVGYPGHQSIPTHNYGLKQLGLRTGAYVAVFDNNLDNLKYPKIKQYDAIFLNNTVGLIFEDPQVREGLLRFVREGGGIGGNHASIFANMDWPEYAQLMGALPSGHREPTERAWLKVADPASAITAGFGDRELLYQDEYVRFTDSVYSRDKLHILLSIDVAKTDMSQMDIPGRLNINLGREDSDYAVSWIREYGQGRVFYTALGHNPTLFTTPETARLMLSGLQYILGDLPADATPSGTIQHGERKAP